MEARNREGIGLLYRPARLHSTYAGGIGSLESIRIDKDGTRRVDVDKNCERSMWVGGGGVPKSCPLSIVHRY